MKKRFEAYGATWEADLSRTYTAKEIEADDFSDCEYYHCVELTEEGEHTGLSTYFPTDEI